MGVHKPTFLVGVALIVLALAIHLNFIPLQAHTEKKVVTLYTDPLVFEDILLVSATLDGKTLTVGKGVWVEPGTYKFRITSLPPGYYAAEIQTRGGVSISGDTVTVSGDGIIIIVLRRGGGQVELPVERPEIPLEEFLTLTEEDGKKRLLDDAQITLLKVALCSAGIILVLFSRR